METTCDSLLNELQLIWDETGENDEERDEMLLQIEQECLKVYQQRVDQAKHTRAFLQETVQELKTEVDSLASALQEDPPLAQFEMECASLKEQLAALTCALEEMYGIKEERLKKFLEIASQIRLLQYDIEGPSEHREVHDTVDELDLSLGRLAELQDQLDALQKEKTNRLQKAMDSANSIYELCTVLGLNFLETIKAVHPSLGEPSSNQSRSISNATMEQLSCTLQRLQGERRKRLEKLQDLGTSLIELWSLMDTPIEEQELFQHVTINIAAKENEVTAAGALSMDVIQKTELEVGRLDQLKASKMKDLILKKQTELRELCIKGHMTINAVDGHVGLTPLESGVVDLAQILLNIEKRIGESKEEVFSRKEILQKIEKWKAACEEDAWLEEHNKDENRYSATRGAYINLKRAEQARATVCKLPALIESLIAKIKSWEEERGNPFLYDGVRLISTLEEKNKLRQEKERDKQKLRDQKRLQEQFEMVFGTNLSSSARTPAMKSLLNSPASRRVSVSSPKVQTGAQELSTRVLAKTALRQQTPSCKETRKDSMGCKAALTNRYDRLSLSGKRKPLSPVSAPARTNSLASSASKFKTPCSPRTIAARNSFVPAPHGDLRTPHQQVSLHQKHHPLVEYSFEEKRLSSARFDVLCNT